MGMAIIAVIGFVVMLVAIFNQNTIPSAAVAGNVPTDKVAPAQEPTAADNGQAEVQAGPVVPVKSGEFFKGGKDAKVVIIEYSDLQCPYCLKNHQTMQQVLAKYGNKVKYVFRNFPLESIHPEARKAAEATVCAGQQGKYLEMVDGIFDANEANAMSVTKWKELAKNFGMNVAQFNDCLDNDKAASIVDNDIQEGMGAGVQGTPATFINGVFMSGAYPLEAYSAEIDKDLAK